MARAFLNIKKPSTISLYKYVYYILKNYLKIIKKKKNVILMYIFF